MKKILLAMMLTAIIGFASTQTASAQQDEWVKGKKGIYSIGIGGTQVWPIWAGGARFGGIGGFGWWGGRGLAVNFSGEYKVWNWIGVGFQTGIDLFVFPGNLRVGVPLGAKANAHIMDAANLDIANKLDVYAGVNFGGGPSFGAGGFGGFFYGGAQVGARYWVTEKLGVFGEFGWGATFANVGVTF